MKLLKLMEKFQKQSHNANRMNKEAYVTTDDGTYLITKLHFDKYGDFQLVGQRTTCGKLTNTDIKRFAKDCSMDAKKAKEIVNIFYELKQKNNPLLTGDMISYENYFYEYDNQWYCCKTFEEVYQAYLDFCDFQQIYAAYENSLKRTKRDIVSFTPMTMEEYEKFVLNNLVFYLPQSNEYLVHM